MTDLIPFHGTQIVAERHDGKQWVAIRPACDSLGLDPDAQLKRLKAQPWATTVVTTGVGADGKRRDMVMADRRTFTMWLATIQTSRIKDDAARDLLSAYQCEAADVLDRYFNEGGAINPEATEHQINAIIFQARAQMELCQAAKGLIHPDHLEAKARIILAQGMGEGAVLQDNRPLYAMDYLAEKHLSDTKRKSVASAFGKRLKREYVTRHGCPPKKYPMTVSNGQVREVNAYTEADRRLMDHIWSTYFNTTPAQEELA